MSKNTLSAEGYAARISSIAARVPIECHVRLDVTNDFILPPNWGFRDRVNINFHMAYVRSGDGSYEFGDRVEKLTRGKVFFVSPGYRHSRHLNPLKPPSMSLVRFSLVRNDSQAPLEWTIPPFAFAFEPRNGAVFHSLFGSLARRPPNSELTQAMYGSLIVQLLIEIYAELVAAGDADVLGDFRMEKAIRWMHEHVDRPASVKQLAARSGLSVNYFRTMFKKRFGKNPYDYMTELRMKRAMELLLETDDKVKDVASALGFTDPFAFSKQFKAVLGVAPSHLKRGKEKTADW
ncbi:helix-turn-helix domain-containing protein [Paenibacillus antri]|nr:AraC family transcriptional regulator [Paenibacillus antri]